MAFKTHTAATEDDSGFSPLIKSIHHAFKKYRSDENRFLLVFRDEWYGATDYIGVKPHENVWAVHNAYLQNRPSDSIAKMVLGLDLRKSFTVQMPQNMLCTMEKFDHLLMRPAIWIPDESNTTPAERCRSTLNEAIYEKLNVA